MLSPKNQFVVQQAESLQAAAAACGLHLVRIAAVDADAPALLPSAHIALFLLFCPARRPRVHKLVEQQNGSVLS